MNELELEYFFFKLPIYKKINITDANRKDFYKLLQLGSYMDENSFETVDSFENTNLIGKVNSFDNVDSFEGYNPFHKVNSTFNVSIGLIGDPLDYAHDGGINRIIIECRRYKDKFHFFIHYNKQEKTFMKVGQYPSIADFHIYELNRYNKLLDKEKLKEFSKGIGLAANGVGIGSFVYLRRIFESLIWDAFNEHKTVLTTDENVFTKMPMDVKIQTLRDFLPPFLVESQLLYSILSLGIHKLQEEECLAYFDTLRVGIEIILDQKLEEQKQQEKNKVAKKAISDLHAKLKK